MVQFSSLYGRLLTQELGSEDSTRLFTDERRKAGINDGIAEFNELTECFVRVASIAWTGGTLEVDLNSTLVLADGDFIRLVSKQSVEVRYTDASSNQTILSGDDLLQRDVAWLDRHIIGWRLSTVASSQMQLPTYFYLRPEGSALFLGLTPVLSTGSSASALVRVPYLARPPVLTSDTAEPYAVGSSVRTDLRPYHRASANYAAAQLEKLRRDKPASDGQLQAYLAWVTRYNSKMRQKGGAILSYARRYFISRTGVGRDPRR